MLFFPTILFLFFSFFWICYQTCNKHAEQILCKDAGIANLMLLNYKHASGIFLFFVVPIVLLESPVCFFKIFIPRNIINLTSFVILTIFCFLVAASQAESKKRDAPPGNNKAGTFRSNIIGYLVLRALFLISYEIFFRGFLFFGSISLLGIIPAFAINVLLYMLMHAFSKRDKMLACIPFGLVLCWVTLVSQSVWPAVILHLELSLVYEMRLYRYYFLTDKSPKQ